MTLTVIVFGPALWLLFGYSLDAVMYPWAHSLVSNPTLTGGWYGQLRAANENRTAVFGMYAQITHDPWKRYRSTDFGGQVQICTPVGIQTSGSIYGKYSRLVLRGSAPFELNFGAAQRSSRAGETPEPLRTPYLGLISAQLKGTWTKDTATVAGPGNLAFVTQDGPFWEGSSPSSEPLTQIGTVLTVTLKKGSEDDYRAVCRGISRERK